MSGKLNALPLLRVRIHVQYFLSMEMAVNIEILQLIVRNKRQLSTNF